MFVWKWPLWVSRSWHFVFTSVIAIYTSYRFLSCPLHSYLLTPWSRVLLEKLIAFQLVNNFHAFYGTRKFITVFTSAHHLSLSWSSSIQSIPPHPTSWRSILILLSHLRLGLPSGLFPSGFPTKTLYTTHLSPIRATCLSYLILLDFITRIVMDEGYRSLTLNLWLLMSYIYIYIYIYDISSLSVNDLTLILLTWRKWWAHNNASK